MRAKVNIGNAISKLTNCVWRRLKDISPHPKIDEQIILERRKEQRQEQVQVYKLRLNGGCEEMRNERENNYFWRKIMKNKLITLMIMLITMIIAMSGMAMAVSKYCDACGNHYEHTVKDYSATQHVWWCSNCESQNEQTFANHYNSYGTYTSTTHTIYCICGHKMVSAEAHKWSAWNMISNTQCKRVCTVSGCDAEEVQNHTMSNETCSSCGFVTGALVTTKTLSGATAYYYGINNNTAFQRKVTITIKGALSSGSYTGRQLTVTDYIPANTVRWYFYDTASAYVVNADSKRFVSVGYVDGNSSSGNILAIVAPYHSSSQTQYLVVGPFSSSLTYVGGTTYNTWLEATSTNGDRKVSFSRSPAIKGETKFYTAVNSSKKDYAFGGSLGGTTSGSTTCEASTHTGTTYKYGSVTISSTPPSIADCTIGSISAYTYDGTAKKPTPTVKAGSTTLTNGTHYTLSYLNNTNAGTATVTITGKGAYSGATSKTFTINKASVAKPTSSGSYTYTGSAQTLTVSGYNSSTMNISGNSATNAGTYTCEISLKDTTNYQWSDGTTDPVSLSWSIAKKAPTLTFSGNTSTTCGGSTSKTYSYNGDGTVTVSTGSSSVATASVNTSTKTVTISGKGAGSTSVTVSAAAGTNYLAASASITVTVSHSYGSWTTVTAATCTAKGSEKRTCACGAVETRETAIIAHTPGAAATCTSVQKCTVCGTQLAGKNASNHSSTATTTTYSKNNADTHNVVVTHNCCGAVKSSTTASHTWNSGVTTTAATCTSTGVMTYTCTTSGCGQTKTGTIAKNASNHSSTATTTTYSKNNADTHNVVVTHNCCGAVKSSTTAAHTWNSGVTTTAATCTSTGVMTYTCTTSGCGQTKTGTIAKNPSNHSSTATTRSYPQNNASTHYVVDTYNCCGAEKSRTTAAHADSNADGKCDSCGYGMAVAPTLTVSPTSVTLGVGGSSKSVTYSYNGNGTVSASSAAPSIATAAISGSTVVITPVAAGSTVVTVSASATSTYLAASKTITVTVGSAPTVTISEIATNNVGWEGWAISGGASINSSGELVLPVGGYISKWFQVDEKYWTIGVNVVALEDIEKRDLNVSAAYYDENFNSVKAQNGYASNGWAYGVTGYGSYAYHTWDGWAGYGPGVKYVQVYVQNHASYSETTLKVNEINFSSEMEETYVGARIQASVASGSISSVKYLWTTASSGVTASQITNTTTNGSVVYPKYGAKGTYYLWTLVTDSNGGQAIIRSDAYTIDNPEIELSVSTTDGSSKTVNAFVFNQENKKDWGSIWTNNGGTFTEITSNYYGSAAYYMEKTGSGNQWHGNQPGTTHLGGISSGTYVIVSHNYKSTDGAGLGSFSGASLARTDWGYYYGYNTLPGDLAINEDGNEHHAFSIIQTTEAITASSAIHTAAPAWGYSTQDGNMTMDGVQFFVFTNMDEGVSVKKYAFGDKDIPYMRDSGITFTGNSFTATENGTYTVYTKTTNGVERVRTVEVSGILDQAGPEVTITNNGSAKHSDPSFASGWNGVSTYNNSGNGNVVLTRKADGTAPNDSGYVMHIETKGAATPGHGGFYFATPAVVGYTYITKIVARIPTGYTIEFGTNGLGSNGPAYTWLTSNAGTGDWKTYIMYVRAGSEGSPSTTNFFYLNGGSTATASSPVVWDVAYANVYANTSMAWTNQNVTVTGNADDKNWETVAYAFTTTDTEPTSWTAVSPTTGTVTANYTATYGGAVFFWAKDTWGNVSMTATYVDRLEKEAPTVTMGAQPAWSTTSSTISWSGTDTGGSGIAGYEITHDKSTIGNVGTTSYTWNTTTNPNGVNNASLYVRAIDNAGNVGEWSEARYIRIDISAPTVTLSSSSVLLGNSVTLTLKDDSSGVIGWMVSTSNSTPSASASGWTGITANTNTTATYKPTSAVPHYFWAKDQAGNVSAVATLEVKADKEVSKIEITNNGSSVHTETFETGIVGASVYNNLGNGNVTLSRIADATAPNNTGYVMQVKTTGEANPYHGGFYSVSVTTGEDDRLTARIVAKIPVGYTINFASNTEFSQRWLTTQQGTGNWETYIVSLSRTTASQYTNVMCFYLIGGSTATTSNPVTWQVARFDLYKGTVANWDANAITLTGKAQDTVGIVGYAFTRDGVSPSVWTEVASTTSEVTATYSATGNGSYFFWAKDANGNISKTAIYLARTFTATLDQTELYYDGTEKRPTATVVEGTRTLTASGKNIIDMLGITKVSLDNGATYSNGVWTLDASAGTNNVFTTVKFQLWKNGAYISEPMAWSNTGRMEVTFTKDSTFDTIRFGANGSTADCCLWIGTAGLVDGATYTFSFNVDSFSSSIIKISKIQLEVGSGMTAYEASNLGDYYIAYKNNIEVGTATATIVGLGNYVGNSVDKTFTIKAGNYKVNGNLYATLKDAVDSTSTSTQTTIEVVRDVTDNVEAHIIEGRDIILDLKGKKITVGNAGERFILNNGALTLQDSVGNGEIYLNQVNSTSVLKIIETYGLLVINSGTLTLSGNSGKSAEVIYSLGNAPALKMNGGTINVTNVTDYARAIRLSGGTFNMTGGNINVTGSNTYMYGILNAGNTTEINISGGNINVVCPNSAAYGVLIESGSTTPINISGTANIYTEAKWPRGICNENISTKDIVITGGTITAVGTTDAYGIYNSKSKTILGTKDGTVNPGIPTVIASCPESARAITSHLGIDFYDGIVKSTGTTLDTPTGTASDVETGYAVVKGSDGTYNTAYLSLGNYEVNNKLYVTLADAYKAITGGSGTIKAIRDDITDDSTVTIDSGKAITLDTNGKTMTKTISGLTNNGELIINGNGTIQTLAGDTNVINDLIYNAGKITINNGNLINNGVTGNYYRIINNVGTTIINGGSLTNYMADNTNSVAIELANNSSLEINGGAIKTRWMGARMNSSAAGNGATVKMTAGKIDSDWHGFWFCGNSSNSSQIEITGGTIDAYRHAVSVESNNTGNVTVTGGTLISGYVPIYNGGTGVVTIGTKDGNVSTTVPDLTGGTCGVESAGGLHFYDGILKGQSSTGIMSNTTVTDVETGYAVATGNDGTYNTAYLGLGNYKVGDKYFVTLKDAVDSITTTEQTTIEVVREDITDNTNVTIAADKNIIIDLKGKTISVDNVTADYFITNSGNLELVDSQGNGTINMTVPQTSKDVGMIKNIDAGNVTITSGTYNLYNDYGWQSVIYQLSSGTVTINGGKIYSECNGNTNTWATGIYARNGKVIVNDGEISAKAPYMSALGIADPAQVFDNTLSIEVYGGTITGYTETGYDAGIEIGSENTTLTIGKNDGTVSTANPVIKGTDYAVRIHGEGINLTHNVKFYDGVMQYKEALNNGTVEYELPTGYAIATGTDGDYNTAYLALGNYKVGDKYFMTLADAYSAITEASGTITAVREDITDSSTFTVANGKTITLDTNGKTITRTTGLKVESGGTLNITGTGEMTSNYEWTMINVSGTLNVESATLTYTGSSASAVAFAIWIKSSGIANINSGKVSAYYATIYNEGGTLNVNGGEIEVTGASDTTSKTVLTITATTGSTINMTGGTITASNPSYVTHGINSSGCNVDISGGKIVVNPGEGQEGNAVHFWSSSALSGSVKISGTAVLNGSTGAVSVTGSGATVNVPITITGGTLTTNSSWGSTVSSSGNSGAVLITDGTISSVNGSGVRVDSGNLTITGGTINSTNARAIRTGTGCTSVTIGTKGGTVSTTSPEIISGTAIKCESTLNFYDGIIKGKSSVMDASTTISEVEPGYEVVNGTEGSYKTAFLKKTPTLSASDISVKIGETIEITHGYNGDGVVTAISGSNSIAEISSVDNTKLVILGVTKGSTQVTLSASEGTEYAGAEVTFAVTVEDSPIQVTTNPENVAVKEGNAASFTVVATGSNLSYQWYKGGSTGSGTLISGATEATYTIPAASVTRDLNETYYYCKVSNASGETNSTRAKLTVYYAPEINVQPANQTVNALGKATFSVGVEAGNPSDTIYQWQESKDNGSTWTNLSGKTNATCEIEATGNMNGYKYRVIIGNTEYRDVETSSVATLTVNKIMLEKPTVSVTVPEYNGKQQTAVLEGFYEDTMGVQNNTRTDAGTQDVVVSLDDTENYEWADGTTDDIEIEWTIAKKEATVTANAQTITYGGSIATEITNATLSNEVTGHKLSAVTLTTNDTNAGTGTITAKDAKIADASGNDVTSNYTIKYVTGTLTINKKVLNAPTLSKTYTYDGKQQTAVLDGFFEDTMEVSNNTRTDAGTQVIRVALKYTNNYEWSDGSTTPVLISWTIDKKTPSLSAPTTALKAGDTVTVTYSYDGDGTVTATSGNTSVATITSVDTTAKTITIKGITEGDATITLSAAAGTNYTEGTGTFTVNVTERPEPILMAGSINTDVFGNTSFTKAQISEITIETTIPSNITDYTNWDVSLNDDGSVMAYLVPDGTLADGTAMYHLHIAGDNNGNVIASSGRNLFYSYTNCTAINGLDKLDTSRVNSMSDMFEKSSSLISLDLTSFDTSNVTSMSYMFYQCKALTSVTFGEKFDTKNVTTMHYMFRECSALTSVDLSNLDANNVTAVDSMFNDCSKLTYVNLTNFDTSNKLKDMSWMFGNCDSLTSVNLNSLDTSGVTNMNNLFYSCDLLENIYINIDTSSTENMSGMFNMCKKLSSIDLSSFNTSNVKDMARMFYTCSGLTELYISNFNTSNVENMSAMFMNCSNLTVLDISNFSTNKVTNMQRMFFGNGKLKILKLNLNFDKINGSEMFYNNNELTSIISLATTPMIITDSNGAVVDNGLKTSNTKAVIYVPNATVESDYEDDTNYASLLSFTAGDDSSRIEPILGLQGEETVTVAFKSTYTDAGAKVAGFNQADDADITPAEVKDYGYVLTQTSNNVDTNNAGTYNVTYKLTLDGVDVDTISRTVIVEKATPTISALDVTVESGKTIEVEFTYTGDSTNITATTGSSTVATVESINVANKKIVIKGGDVTGSATITLSAGEGTNYTSATGSFNVTVSDSAVTIVTEPSNVTVKHGTENVSFTVSASGTNLQYQWYKASAENDNGSPILGATSETLTIDKADVTKDLNGTYYYCNVSNSSNTSNPTKSRSALLTVYYEPTITTQPTNTFTMALSSATFSVEVANGNPSDTTYKWQYRTSSTGNWENISEATSADYTIDSVTYSMNNYEYRVLVGNREYEDAVVSNAATLTVNKIILEKPEVSSTVPEYNGKQQTAVLEGFDEDTMGVQNNTRTDAGEQEVIVYLKDKSNYIWSTSSTDDIELSWTIAKKEATVTANEQTITYGSNISTGTANATLSNQVSGHYLSAVTLEADSTEAGTHMIMAENAKIADASGNDVTSNYNISYNTGKLTVTTIGLALPTIKGTYTYDGSEQTVELNNFDSSKMTVSKGNATNAGEYTVTVKLKDKSNYTWSTGLTDDIELSWTIAKKEATVTANAQTITYGSNISTGTSNATLSDAVSGHKLSAVTLKANSIAAGTHTIEASNAKIADALGNDVSANYTISYETGVLTVNKQQIAKPTISATIPEYTGSEQTAVLDGFYKDIMEVEDNTRTDAGTQDVIVSLKDPNNYEWSDGTKDDIVIEWTINTKAVTVTAKAQKITYGGAIATGIANATLSDAVSGHRLSAVTLNATTAPAGTHTITASDAKIADASGKDVTANYTITYETGTLTVEKATATITVSNATVKVGEIVNVTFEYTGDALSFEAISGSESIAKIVAVNSVSKTITISGVATGSTSIEIKAQEGTNYSEITKSFQITVTDSTISVTTDPNNVTVKCEEKDATFTVAATGTNLKYQWYKASTGTSTGTQISGATNPTYSIPAANVTKDLNGTYYYCNVSNTTGVVSSKRALLTVYYLPEIITQPQDVTVTATETFTLTIEVENGNPENTLYQWQYSSDSGNTWKTVSNTDTTSYAEIASYSKNGWMYRCVVWNEQYVDEKVISDEVTLTVNKKSLKTQGITVSLDPTEVDYTGEAIGQETVVATVKDGNTTLTPYVQYVPGYSNNKDVGTAIVTISGRNDYKDEITVTFKINAVAPKVTLVDKTAEYTGSAISIENATATGTEKGTTPNGTVTYAYYTDYDCTAATTKANSGAATNGGAPVNVGTYYVKATMEAAGNYTEATSNVATLTITQKEITVTANNQTITYGSNIEKGVANATLSGEVDGHKLSSVTLIANTVTAGTHSIEVSNAKIADASGNDVTGNYDINYVDGTLTVAKASSSITASNATVRVGETVKVSFTYTGDSENITAVSKDNSIAKVIGVDSSDKTVTVEGVATGKATITISATDGTNYLATSGSFDVTATDSVIGIVTNPSDVTVRHGELDAIFEIEASGTNLKYQWYKALAEDDNGSPILGATSETLTIDKADVTKDLNGTYYYCAVSNTTGTISSEKALLTVYYEPTIVVQPANQNAVAGGTVTFTVDAEEGNPAGLTYKWQYRIGSTGTWTDISTATGTSYTTAELIDSVRSYEYRVVVSNAQYSVASNVVKAIITDGNYSVDGVFYHTLEEAYNAINTSTGTIVVVKSNTDNSTFTVEAGKTVTIETGNNTITKTDSYLTNKGTLIIDGNGTIKTGLDTLIYNDGGTLTVNNGTLICDLPAGNANWYAIFQTSGTTNINGGTIKSTVDGSQDGYGARLVYLRDGTINITGGTILVEGNYGIAVHSYDDAKGTVNISGGTVKSEQGIAICLTASTSPNETILNVTGGRIESGNSDAIFSLSDITIGTNDASVSQEVPEIIGYTNGIFATKDIKFYDGIIKGSDAALNVSGISEVPAGYEVFYDEEVNGNTTYETAYLIKLVGDITLERDKEEWTNTEVVVTITWPETRYQKQIKIGDGEWQEYSESTVTISSNTTLYARIINGDEVKKTAEIEIDNIDKIAPKGRVRINEGDKYTNSSDVVLTLTDIDNDSGVTEMAISNTTTVDSFEPFKTTKDWTLEDGEGLRGVFVVLKDDAGNMSVQRWGNK